MKLNGILDPLVMGGIDNYEKAFLNDEYKSLNPNDKTNIQKLENLIAEQIPLLTVGVQIHKMKAPTELHMFHQRLEQCLASLKVHVEKKYGKRVSKTSDQIMTTLL